MVIVEPSINLVPKFSYLAVVLSLETKQVVRWWFGGSHSSDLAYRALLDTLRKHTPPDILRIATKVVSI